MAIPELITPRLIGDCGDVWSVHDRRLSQQRRVEFYAVVMEPTPSGQVERPPRFGRSELQVVAGISIILVSIGFWLYAPTQADSEMIDHALFTKTVDEMRAGAGYYEAMERSFAVVYGPDRAELTETVRGFRPPTTFLFWMLLPDDRAIWLVYVGVAAISGVLASRIARHPLIGTVVTAYLLAVGMLNVNGLWTAQFTATELWAIPFMLGAVLAVMRERWWLAAMLGLAATSVRETAATLVLAGAGLATLGRLPRKPWFIAVLTATVLYFVHASLAAPFIEPGVAAALPSRAEIPGSVLRIIGFGLPAGPVLGSILWIAALWNLFRSQQHSLLLASYLALPLVGLVLERHYWGILVVPLTLIWGLDELIDVMGKITKRITNRSPFDADVTA
jgi:hypothetical protein